MFNSMIKLGCFIIGKGVSILSWPHRYNVVWPHFGRENLLNLILNHLFFEKTVVTKFFSCLVAYFSFCTSGHTVPRPYSCTHIYLILGLANRWCIAKGVVLLEAPIY